MSELFILGAGFSRAVCERMPLMKDLGTGLMRSLADERLDGFAPDDFEVWLTYLSQAHPWLSEADYLRNRAKYLDISSDIGRLLWVPSRQAQCAGFPARFQNLMCYWHETRAIVVTLNYDPLIEECLEVFPVREMPGRETAIGTVREGNGRPILRQVYPASFVFDRDADQARTECLTTLRLVKLHGTDKDSASHYEHLLPTGYALNTDFAGIDRAIPVLVGWLTDSDPDALLPTVAGKAGRFRPKFARDCSD